jgi:hypothetical protein
LKEGSEKARARATEKLRYVREKVGISI